MRLYDHPLASDARRVLLAVAAVVVSLARDAGRALQQGRDTGHSGPGARREE